MWDEYQHRITGADVFDAQDWPLPNYPFLRVTRSSSYIAHADLSPEQAREWLRQAYEKGRVARAIENEKLAVPMAIENLESCLRDTLPTLVGNDSFWEYVRQNPRPDAYNDFARTVGLYPIFQPIISRRVDLLNVETEEKFQRYDGGFPWQRYLPAEHSGWAEVQQILNKASHKDPLGLPSFSPEELEVLFAYYSPVIELELGHPDDRIGRPHRRDDSWTTLPQPEVFTLQTHTHWQGEWLPQLVYIWWYPSRPKNHALDIYGGELDGLMFRVTLDWQGKALFYDSVHPCGCYHKWHPAHPDIRFKGESAWDEPLAVLPVSPPPQPYQAVVRLQSKTHYVVGLEFEDRQVEASQAASPAKTYRLFPHSQLRAEPTGDDYLYGPDGLIHGTERLERFLLWNLGIPSAGAMRQWGHHATAFVGRRHFDDPRLFEEYFEWERAD